MKSFSLLQLLFTAMFLASCGPSFPGPRKIDWKKEWESNQTKLKALVQDIVTEGDKKYSAGNNNFPSNFSYPFDDGFFIETSSGQLDPKNLSIKFYVDRGLLDHYSAFIFSNDSTNIKVLDENVANGGNDFKIEPNWYMVND